MLMFILSGCSGAGKNTIINKLMEENSQVDIFTSFTTRPMRENETQGNPYFYYTFDEFEERDKQGVIIEKEFIHGNFYGTSYEILEQKLKDNKILIKDIGVEGTLNLQQKLSDKLNIISVFLDVPKKELIKRITLRGEPKDRVKVRASRFNYELSFRKNYSYIFKFLPLEKAINAMQSIIDMDSDNYQNIFSTKRFSTKKVNKLIQKLQKGKKIAKPVFGFYKNNLTVIKNFESFIAEIKSKITVQKIVKNKEINYAVCYQI